MSVRHVVPVVQAPDAIPAVAQWDVDDLIVVDNTTYALWRDLCEDRGWTHLGLVNDFGVTTNLGVATSWNLGARRAFAEGARYVSLISSSVDWRHGLADWGRRIETLADERGLLTDLAFHATAWHRSIFTKIGWFDESFYPAYNEDIDWLRRLELAGLHVPHERAELVHQKVNMMRKVFLEEAGVATCENAVSLKAAAVSIDFGRNERLYRSKWGGPKHEEQFERPYDLVDSLDYCPFIHSP